MKLAEYETQAMYFRMESAGTAYALLNLSGEVGELHSLLAKALRDGEKPDFAEQAKKELGDILWCLAAVAQDMDTSLEEIASLNIAKLSSRSVRGVVTGSGDNR